MYNSTEPLLYNSFELLTTLSGLRRSLKVTCGATLVPTLVAPFGGSATVTCGCVKLNVGPVLKVFVTVPVITLPAVSCTPVMVRVKLAFAANRFVGLRVNSWLASLKIGVNATGLPPVVRVILLMLLG